MFQDIEVEELLALREQKDITIIDVRSDSEYADSTIPGSLNIPLFDDAERAEVGTIYKQVSVQAAKDKGLELVSAKLPAFIKSFEQIRGPKAVFCWRGGMRSRTTATVLSLMGIRVYRLRAASAPIGSGLSRRCRISIFSLGRSSCLATREPAKPPF